MSDSVEKVITWNVGNKADVLVLAGLLEMAEKYEPLAFALQEVADRSEVLNKFCAKSFYTMVTIREGKHSSAVRVLVRPGVAVTDRGGFLLTDRTFVGRKVAGSHDDGLTAPKWLVYAVVSAWGEEWMIASTHLTPSHQVKAVRSLVFTQVAQIALWLRTQSRLTLMGGDFNESLGAKFNLLAPLKLLGTPFTAPSHGTRAIDMWWAVGKRLTKRRITTTVEALDGYPSDHRPVMLTVSRELRHECPVCSRLHFAP